MKNSFWAKQYLNILIFFHKSGLSTLKKIIQPQNEFIPIWNEVIPNKNEFIPNRNEFIILQVFPY